MIDWFPLAIAAVLAIIALVLALGIRRLRYERERMLTYAAVFALDYDRLFAGKRSRRVLLGFSTAMELPRRLFAYSRDPMAYFVDRIFSLRADSVANDQFN